MPEKPLCDVHTLASLSAEERAERLFSNRFKIVGNLSQWEAQNPTLYAEAREIGKRDGRVGESPSERAARHQREAIMDAPTPALTPEQEIELAEAITKYPRELCKQIFADGTNAEATKLHDENPAEYARAQRAARHFNIIGKISGEPSVRFNYETPSDYRAKIPVPVTEPSGPPPGVAPCTDGVGFAVVDPAAYSAWKQLQSARRIIAEASTK